MYNRNTLNYTYNASSKSAQKTYVRLLAASYNGRLVHINYSQNVINDFKIRDQQNADRAKFSSVVDRGLNKWDYVSNTTGALSAYPTIKSTWRYNSNGGDVRWTGKNGNYYVKSQVKMNGGYAKSINYAQNASKNLTRVGNGLTILSVGTSIISAGVAIINSTDNTSTWVGLGVGIGGAALTVIGSPVIVTGAAIFGAAWGVSQLLYGDEINGSIDSNFGYR